MFKLLTGKTAARKARNKLWSAFAEGAIKIRRKLSTPPYGPFDADILIRKDLDLWVHIGKEVEKNRFYCFFGVGEPSWQAEIEINIPIERSLHCAGQLVVGDDGAVNLAHRGGLGGGKFSVKVSHFSDLINGFERDAVQDGKNVYHWFVLGELGSAALLQRLSEYVHEAARIRELRRDEGAFQKSIGAFGHSSTVTADSEPEDATWTDENDDDGVYSVHRQIAIRRFHAKVQRALATELRKQKLDPKNSRLHGGIGPDVYLCDKNGEMSALFEIKVPHYSQSTFTAIGQLLVYSAESASPPRLILVTRGLPKSRLFERALHKNNIKILRYSIGSTVTFHEIETILA